MREAIEPLGFLFLLLCGACAGEEAPAKHAPSPPAEPPRAVPLVAKTSSELGSIDPAAVKGAFGQLNEKFTDCQRSALDRVEVLAGNVRFFLRIGSDGTTKWAYLEESEVGDRDTEKCLIAVVMNAHWPKPESGDAEARYSMELPLQTTRAPNEWRSDKVAEALGRHGGDIDKCKAGQSAAFHATMYVGPGGKVLSAGIAVSTKGAEEQADCLAKALMKIKGLPSPGSWPAKVSFGL